MPIEFIKKCALLASGGQDSHVTGAKLGLSATALAGLGQDAILYSSTTNIIVLLSNLN